jgi:hypothetical protein
MEPIDPCFVSLLPLFEFCMRCHDQPTMSVLSQCNRAFIGSFGLQTGACLFLERLYNGRFRSCYRRCVPKRTYVAPFLQCTVVVKKKGHRWVRLGRE